ncbi:hypothetical protein D9Q98_001566 [Chlorella vulgaris]|uniref:Beclin 1 n=1 Tax=Chlorella vulgaris TaxID=3077 RepID=A0A9D4TV65_CHLVU|nr:hypothetical protein D9Q98_001566 [Chlorella vulgaris]
MKEHVLQCQQCKTRLQFSDHDAGALRFSGSGSGLSARLEESFLVLASGDEARGLPPGGGGDGGPPTAVRRLEESFVVLQGGSSGGKTAPGTQSMLLDSGGGGAGSSGMQRIPFDQKLRALARVFEAASEEVGVELPLCSECAGEVHRELEAQLGELQQEVAAYEAALVRLQAEGVQPMREPAFQEAAAQAQGQVQAERERLAAAERELAGAQAQLRGVEAEACALDGVEQRYWHTFNDFQLRLGDHLGDRDALQHRLEASSGALCMLRRTSVYNDLFRIWFHGACGTISGLRLGRTAQQAVEWDEINAAWGQAVLLLATLARACGVQFRGHRLLPQGSYPQVAEVRGGATHDLHGPVSKFLCASYDKAQAGFLACLKEFADWLVARGAVDGQGVRFALPCPIEGDKVAGLTIRLMFNKDKNWTRALKHMLVDLKFVLKYALVALDNRAGLAAGPPGTLAPVAALQREDFAGAASTAAVGTLAAAAAGMRQSSGGSALHSYR